jgi:hypothetical protein
LPVFAATGEQIDDRPLASFAPQRRVGSGTHEFKAQRKRIAGALPGSGLKHDGERILSNEDSPVTAAHVIARGTRHLAAVLDEIERRLAERPEGGQPRIDFRGLRAQLSVGKDTAQKKAKHEKKAPPSVSHELLHRPVLGTLPRISGSASPEICQEGKLAAGSLL